MALGWFHHKKDGANSYIAFFADEDLISRLRRETGTPRSRPIVINSEFGPVELYERGNSWYRLMGKDAFGRDVAKVKPFVLAIMHRWLEARSTTEALREMMAVAVPGVPGMPPKKTATKDSGVEEADLTLPPAPLPTKPGVLHVDKVKVEEKRKRNYVPPPPEKLEQLKDRFKK